MTRLRDLREDKDLTQKELAAHLIIHQSTYSDYELGNLNIPVWALIKLSRFYETSVDYILKLTNIKEPYPKDYSEL